jgi:hypothetical protein
MTTEKYALRELRLSEIERRLLSRRFGLRAMRRTLLLTLLYGVIVLLSTIRDRSPYDGALLFCGLLAIIFTAIDEHDAHMRSHIADLLEFIRLANEKQNEK